MEVEALLREASVHSHHTVPPTQVLAWWTDSVLISKGSLKTFLTMTPWRSTSTTVMHRIRGKPSLRAAIWPKRTQTWFLSHLPSHSGEVGFRAMSESLGWAKRPMLQRIHLLPSSMPVTMLYGEYSWVDSSSGERVIQIRNPAFTKLMVSGNRENSHGWLHLI